MTDLEMTKLCAEGMEEIFYTIPPKWSDEGLWCYADGAPDSKGFYYDPLHDDAQAMALVKKLRLQIEQSETESGVTCVSFNKEGRWFWSADLNRAIVGCVAEMQKAKHG